MRTVLENPEYYSLYLREQRIIDALKRRGITSPQKLVAYAADKQFGAASRMRALAVIEKWLYGVDDRVREKTIKLLWSRLDCLDDSPLKKRALHTLLTHSDYETAVAELSPRLAECDYHCLIKVIDWLRVQDEKALREGRGREVSAKVMKRLPKAYEQALGQRCIFVFIWLRAMDKYPFNADEFAEEVVRAAFVGLESPGAIEFQTIDSLFKMVVAREDVAWEQIDQRIHKILTSGNDNVAAILLWEIFKYDYGDKSKRGEFLSLVKKHHAKISKLADRIADLDYSELNINNPVRQELARRRRVEEVRWFTSRR
jgi:hypothetical protein